MKTWGDNVSSKHLFSNCKVLTGVGLLVNSTEAGATFFFYKNNFIRTKILVLAKKKKQKKKIKNNLRLFLSNNRNHDQNLSTCLEKTLSTCDIPEYNDIYIVTESDNCSWQYKSTEHFHDLQSLADSLKKKQYPGILHCRSWKKGSWPRGRNSKDWHPTKDS